MYLAHPNDIAENCIDVVDQMDWEIRNIYVLPSDWL